jgi:hypothetical protein
MFHSLFLVADISVVLFWRIEECAETALLRKNLYMDCQLISNAIQMDYFPGQSFFQTRCVAPCGQLLYNFVNKNNSLFYITVATAT